MTSNKTLALLIVAAVVISLGGTLISLNKLEQVQRIPVVTPKQFTGHVTSAGQLNLSISSNTSCVVDTNVSFGSANKPGSTYVLSTEKNNSAQGFNDCLDAALVNNCKGLQINNTGNTNLNISFTSSKNASTLLFAQTGLDATDFVYEFKNGTFANTSTGCKNATGLTLSGNIQDTNQLPQGIRICNNLTYTDGSDTMTLEFNVTLEADVSPGTKTAAIVVTCEDSPWS